MAEELNNLTLTNKEVEEKCQVKYVPKNRLSGD